MKKGICAALAVAMCFSFCACNSRQGNTVYDAHEKTVKEIRRQKGKLK